MPYQRSGRDYGPGSIGGTTKYSSRKQVSIGVPDYNAKKKARKPAPKPVQPAKKDPGVAGVPGGLTGRGQNNPALTDPGVMGVPGGVTGRQAPVTRQKQPSAGSDSTLGFGPMQPTRMDPYLSFSGTPNTQQQRERSTPVTGQPGGSTPTNTSTGLSFNGPVNGIPWSSGHLPLASSSLTNLTLGSLEPQSPPLTAEEQQELEYFRQKREAFRRGETIARNAWELNTAPPKTAAAPKQGGLKKGPASNASPELYGTQGDSIFDLGMNRAHTDTLQPQISPQDLNVFDRALQFDTPPVQPASTPQPQGNAAIGGGQVVYGSSPGSLEADIYRETMRALGWVNVQNYEAQRNKLTPGYQPPKPTQWKKNTKSSTPTAYEPRPGLGGAVSYQNLMRSLGYLHTQDFAAQQAEAYGAPQPEPLSRPVEWQGVEFAPPAFGMNQKDLEQRIQDLPSEILDEMHGVGFGGFDTLPIAPEALAERDGIPEHTMSHYPIAVTFEMISPSKGALITNQGEKIIDSNRQPIVMDFSNNRRASEFTGSELNALQSVERLPPHRVQDTLPISVDQFESLNKQIESQNVRIEKITGQNPGNPLLRGDGKTAPTHALPTDLAFDTFLTEAATRIADAKGIDAAFLPADLLYDTKEANLATWHPNWQEIDAYDRLLQNYERSHGIDTRSMQIRPNLKSLYRQNRNK